MPTRKKPQPRKPRRREVDLRSLAPRVREEALRLAKGDRSRIEVVSKTEAIVR